jgi:hypothetical protein
MFSEKKEDCPFWRGPCREHKCRLYVQIMGKHPQSEEQINRFGCSFEFLPMLLIENAQQSRQTGASVDSFKNEMVRMNGVAAVQHALTASHAADAPLPLGGGAG